MTSREYSDPLSDPAEDAQGVPSPEEPANDLERARAESFAERVDNLLAGEEPPPAMPPEERALVDVAGAIRAGVLGRNLDETRLGELVESAFSQRAAAASEGQRSGRSAASPMGAGASAEAEPRAPAGAQGNPEPARSEAEAAAAPEPNADPDAAPSRGEVAQSAKGVRSAERSAPKTGVSRQNRARGRWRKRSAAIGLAAAALAAGTLAAVFADSLAQSSPVEAQPIPDRATSRPADPLVGEIPRERAADARARTDAIFADRLQGFRTRTWGEPGDEEP